MCKLPRVTRYAVLSQNFYFTILERLLIYECENECNFVYLIDMTSELLNALTDFDQIWYANAKYHAHNDELVKIEAGSRVPIWRTSVFTNRK